MSEKRFGMSELEIAHRMERVERGPSSKVREFLEKYRDDLPDPLSVLEAGSGEGRNLWLFKELGIDVAELHGVEMSTGAAALSRELLSEKGIDATIHEQSFVDLTNFEDGKFGLVFSHSAVHNSPTIEDAGRAIGEIGRVLAPQGLYYLRESRFPRPKDANRAHHVAYFTPEELVKMSEAAGLEWLEGGIVRQREADEQWGPEGRATWEVIFRKI